MNSSLSLADSARSCPIGVFDSGVGGLTVVRAVRDLLPNEDIFYIGDTARLPYGTKDQTTIERYSQEICGLLLAERAKVIVVACNTASALALPRLHETLRVPVIGVIAPGARAAAKASHNGKIGVLATPSTAQSGAYERAIHALRPDAQVFSQAAPLLVPLIEEGWLEDPVTREVLTRYLEPVLRAGIDTLVLGCTHYPLLRPLLQRLTPGIQLVDSAQNCAVAVTQLLNELALGTDGETDGRLNVALTDSSNPFLGAARDALRLRIDHLERRTVQGVAMVG